MKKIINDPKDVVSEMMQGIVAENKNLSMEKETQIIFKNNIDQDKVTIISGGGSGHEPTHAGYIGNGMLDAAICGAVFTSPTPDMIKAGLDKIKTNSGTLMVVKNYSGDLMNFEIAKELSEDGEDIAEGDSTPIISENVLKG